MVEIKPEPHEVHERGEGSSATNSAGNRKRPYPDEQLNDVKWLRRVWAKARDQERCANERAAKLREEIKAAKEQIMAADTAATEQAEAAGKDMSELQKTVLALERRAASAEEGKRQSDATAKEQVLAAETAAKKQAKAAGKASSKDMGELRAQLVAVSAEFGGRLRAREEELEGARETALALEKRAKAGEKATRRSAAAAKEQIQATATAATEQAEATDKLGKDLARTCEELAASRAQLASANEGADATRCALAAAEAAQAQLQAEAQAQAQELAECRAKLDAANALEHDVGVLCGKLHRCRERLEAANEEINQLAACKERARAAEAEVAGCRAEMKAANEGATVAYTRAAEDAHEVDAHLTQCID
jgi:chromosome segregation ATPase